MVSVTIIGAGISGLATGLGLKNIGYSVHLLDKKTKLCAEPMGLTLQPAGVKSMEYISPTLRDKVMNISCASGDIGLFCSLYDRRVALLSQSEVEHRFGTSFITLPRQLFYDILIEELGRENITTGRRFKEYFEDKKMGRIRAVFLHGHEEYSDLIIGAEGAYSLISEMIPLPYANRYRGTTAWYGIAEGIPLSEIEKFVGFGFGPKRASGIFPMIGDRVSWWCSYGTWFGPEFDPQGDHHALLKDLFSDYRHGPLLRLIQSTVSIRCYDIYDKVPYPRNVGRGRATLVGDAAHQAAPVLAYGADQALEDAASLSLRLGRNSELGSNIGHLLREYEYARFQKNREMTIFARIVNNCFHARTSINQHMVALCAPIAWHLTKNRYLENGLLNRL